MVIPPILVSCHHQYRQGQYIIHHLLAYLFGSVRRSRRHSDLSVRYKFVFSTDPPLTGLSKFSLSAHLADFVGQTEPKILGLVLLVCQYYNRYTVKHKWTISRNSELLNQTNLTICQFPIGSIFGIFIWNFKVEFAFHLWQKTNLKIKPKSKSRAYISCILKRKHGKIPRKSNY